MLDNNFNGVQHLGIPVTDLYRSEAFYRRLGFQKIHEKTLELGSRTIPAMFLERGGFVLELFQLPETELIEIRDRKDGHIDHVAFDVNDIERAYAELKAAGLIPLEEAPVSLPFWEHGIRYFNVRGPDGEKLEFLQRLK